MRKNLPLTLIFMVVFVDLLGFGLLIPILPSFAKNVLHVPESAVGAAIAIYSLVQFIFNPVFGSFSDKHGRRNVILITLLINAAGYLVFSMANSLIFLLLSRVIGGIGGSSIGVAQAYITDVTSKEERSKGMGLIGVAFGMGFVFGPLAGGVLSHYGYDVVGYVSAAFSLSAWLLSVFYLPESLPKEKRHTGQHKKILDITAFKRVFSNSTITVVILLFFTLTFSVANIYGTFALMGIEIYHFRDSQNGYIYGIIGIVSTIIQGGLVGRLSKKYSDTKLISVGAAFLMIGLALLPFGGSFTGVALVACVLSMGSGLLQPILLSLVSKVAPEGEHGMVLGVNQSLSSFARMLGPLWGGFAFQYFGYQFPFLTGAVFMFFLFLFSIFFLSNHLPDSRK